MDPFKSNIDHLTPELMQRYLDGDLSKEERHEVEKLMAESDFDSDAMEGFQNNAVDLENDLLLLNQSLIQRIRKEKVLFPLWFKIAASVLVIAVSIALVINYDFNFSEIQNEISSVETDEASVNPSEDKDALDLVNQDSLMALREEVVLSEPKPKKDIEPDNVVQVDDSENQEDQSSLETIAQTEADDHEFVESTDATEEIAETLAGKVSGVIADKNPIVEDKISSGEKFTETEETEDEATTAPINLKKADRAQPSTIQETLEKAKRSGLESRSAMAQSRTNKKIKGQVTSIEDDEPLPGVNIILKGTTIGTVTDIDGNYSLDLQGGSENTLVASFIGLSAQEVEVGDRSQVDIQLSPDVVQLSEVVVTGYAIETKKQNLGYAIQSVDDSDIRKNLIAARPQLNKSEYQEYLQNNVRIPIDSISSRVVVKFDVLPDGSLTNFIINKAPGPAYREEAIRLIKEGPQWLPATENDSAVTDQVKVRVRFK
ncbi:MAG: carboxypeptidase-like regulatory domain-containing protein [Bacteroidota bacterium]